MKILIKAMAINKNNIINCQQTTNNSNVLFCEFLTVLKTLPI